MAKISVVNNGTAQSIPGDIVKGSGQAFGVVLAQANAANLGLWGVWQTATDPGKDGTIGDTVEEVNCDVTVAVNDALYLSAITPGKATNVAPDCPYFLGNVFSVRIISGIQKATINFQGNASKEISIFSSLVDTTTGGTSGTDKRLIFPAVQETTTQSGQLYLDTQSPSAKACIAYRVDRPIDSSGGVSHGPVAWLQAHRFLILLPSVTVDSASSVNTGSNYIAGMAGLNVKGNWQNGWPFYLSTTGVLPSGVVAGTPPLNGFSQAGVKTPPTAATGTVYYARLSSGNLYLYDTSAHAITGGATGLVSLGTVGSGNLTVTPDLTYNNNEHRHFGIEIADSNGQLNTHLSFVYGDDLSEVGFFSSNVYVRDGEFRVVGAQGNDRNIVLGSAPVAGYGNLAYNKGNWRWAMRADSTAEGGSSSGSDFRLVAYDDAGVAQFSPIFSKRSNGYVGIGTTSLSSTAKLTIQGSVAIGTSAGPTWSSGTGVPAAALPNGSIYSRTDGSTGTTMYFRVNGAWVAGSF